MSSSPGSPTGANASSDSSSSLPNLALVTLERDHRFLQHELTWARDRIETTEGERDDARAQHKLAIARIASLERQGAIAGWFTAGELVDKFDRALPFGGLDEVATIQEMVHVGSPLSSTARPRLPIEILWLVVKASSSTADLFSWALVCSDVLKVAMEELAHRPIVFDLRKRKSGIESFLGPRHRYKYDRITFAVEWTEGGCHEQVPVPSVDRIPFGQSPDCFIDVGTLVLNVIPTAEGYRPSTGRDDCYLPFGIGNLLYLFEPDVYHSHADLRGLPASSVEFSYGVRPLAVDIYDKGLPPFYHYQTAIAVYSGCTPKEKDGMNAGYQASLSRPLYEWADTGLRRKDGSRRIQWSPCPAKIVFVVGGAHRDGIAWEYVKPRDDRDLNSEDSSDDSPLVEPDDWRREWHDHLLSYPNQLGLAKTYGDGDWFVPHRPIQAFAVEIWVAEDAVDAYNDVFESDPLFARMKTTQGEPITWKAISLEGKRASTDKQDVEIIRGLGGVDGD